jgi:hypothetical protein
VDRKYIYLDLKDWIDISRDFKLHQNNRKYSSDLDWVLEEIAGGKICFPLVDTLFLEFYKNSSSSRRTKLANVMSLLSLGNLIVNKRTRLAYEVRLALAKFFKTTIVKSESMIVRGLSRAFVTDEVFTQLTGINLRRLSQIIKNMDNVNAWVDFFQSVDEQTRNYLMNKFRESNKKQIEILESFRKSSNSYDLLLRAYYARLFMDNQTTFLQIMDEYGLSKDDLLKIDGATLFSEIPSFEIEAKLTIESMKQKSRSLKENDCYDISSLAAAIPYCSIIVTEAFWIDLCKRLKFDKKYNCKFLKNYRLLHKSIEL